MSGAATRVRFYPIVSMSLASVIPRRQTATNLCAGASLGTEVKTRDLWPLQNLVPPRQPVSTPYGRRSPSPQSLSRECDLCHRTSTAEWHMRRHTQRLLRRSPPLREPNGDTLSRPAQTATPPHTHQATTTASP